MKVLVAVKRVVDHNVNIQIKADQSGVNLDNVKMAMNPFDEIALEEALRLRDKQIATEIVAVSCGVAQCQETLRTALAMGADRAIWVETDETLQPLAVAKLLHQVYLKENPHIIFLGKQAIDDDANQTGQMLAALAEVGQGTFASAISVHEVDKTILVTREVDGGIETILLRLPAVITADLRLNAPRYVTLPNLIKAKKKIIEHLTPTILGVDVSPRLEILNVCEPPVRKPGLIFDDVSKLIHKLKSDTNIF